MPTTAFGGQSQQRWGTDTLNKYGTLQDLLLFDTTGEPRATLAARKAGMLVLAFFHTGCETSRTTLPYLQRLTDTFAESKKLTVWGVSQDPSEETAAFASQLGVTFPVCLDRDGYHSMLLGVVSVPTIFLVDGGGRVLRKFAGWDRDALNTLASDVAAFAEQADAAPLVPADDPASDRAPGCGSRRASTMV
jgi:peroxiredoxin